MLPRLKMATVKPATTMGIFMTYSWLLIVSQLSSSSAFQVFRQSDMRQSLTSADFVENGDDWDQTASTLPYDIMLPSPSVARSRRTKQAMLLDTASQLAELLYRIKFDKPQREQLWRSYYQLPQTSGSFDDLQHKQHQHQQKQLSHYHHQMNQQSTGKDSVSILPLKSLRIGRRR